MFHEGPVLGRPARADAGSPAATCTRCSSSTSPALVFCGHDHLYYRTTRDGVTYVVTGGGGAPPYRPENSQIAIPGDVFVKDVDSWAVPWATPTTTP